MAFLQEYTMLDELGKGGFATVYKVRHNDLGYIRAIRVLNETIVNTESKTYQKFLRECKLLLRLGNGNHPNIVHIYQPLLLENKALVEMDYVDGQDIMHFLKQERDFVSVEEVIRMATQMSSALAYCHEEIYRFCMDRDSDNLQDDPNDGSKVLLDDQTRKRLVSKYKVIHNDIHSGNIMRREDGNFVLLDFGLAINGDEVVRSSRHANGAPEFKSPEKWDDESILSEPSDIYSFGIVLFQYLAGRVPFPYDTNKSNRTEAEYLLSKAHQNAIPPSIEDIRKEFFERKYDGREYKKDYPQWLEDMILKCLQKNPADRFRNGKELYDFITEHAFENGKISSEVEMQLSQLKAKNKELVSEMENLREINRSLNMVVNEKQNLTLNTTDELKTLKKQYDDLAKETSELRSTNSLLNRQLNEKQNLLSNTNNELINLKKSHENLEAEVINLRDINRSLNTQLNEKQSKIVQMMRSLRENSEQVESTGVEKEETRTTPTFRFCRKCGEQLSPSAKFCRKCGSQQS